MPRQPRLVAPGTLHHVRVRGLERRALFRDDTDRADFIGRGARLAKQRAWPVCAWALLPWAAGAFNRRHNRGWAVVASLRRGREVYVGDERVRGASAVVEQLRAAVCGGGRSPGSAPRWPRPRGERTAIRWQGLWRQLQ